MIQPNGGIVTAGSRQVGTASDFVLTRHSPNGTLDTSFGTKRDRRHRPRRHGRQGLRRGAAPRRRDRRRRRGRPRGVPEGRLRDRPLQPRRHPEPELRQRRDRQDRHPRRRGPGRGGRGPARRQDRRGGAGGQGRGLLERLRARALQRRREPRHEFRHRRIVTTDFGGEDAAVALAVQADGKLVAAGTASDHIALARYRPDGTLDTTFGSGGTTVNPGFGVANGLALTPGGGILLAGDSGGDFLPLAYRPDGTPNPNFGHLGSVTTDINGGSSDFAENLVVDAQGRIILVGRATSRTILDMALARYNADGTLDTSFANHGSLTADFHGRGEFGQDVALDQQGRLIAAGYTANGSDTDFALMRANS